MRVVDQGDRNAGGSSFGSVDLNLTNLVDQLWSGHYRGRMRVVKVQYAKTHLSALLQDVEQGAEVIISRGDHPVARLAPLDTDGEREL